MKITCMSYLHKGYIFKVLVYHLNHLHTFSSALAQLNHIRHPKLEDKWTMPTGLIHQIHLKINTEL